MLSTFFFSQAFLLCSLIVHCFARDTITGSSLLSDENQETLVSSGEKFELGFFTPPGGNGRYIGIWYYKLKKQTVVWVANRDNPVSDNSGVLAIADDGNLKMLNGTGETYWNTNLERSSNANDLNRSAKLMDSGNFILSDNQGATSLWQSFEHPTDTFLLGMDMNKNFNLTSWNSGVDPKMGNFTFAIDQEDENQFTILNGLGRYWRSGKSSKFNSVEMPSWMFCFLSNFTHDAYTTCHRSSRSVFNTTRVLMNSSGQIQQWELDVQKKEWSLEWREPRDKCSVLKACGQFESCNSNSNLTCRCLPGFKPENPEEWNRQNFKGGCSRKSTCGNRFLSLKMMKVSDPDSTSPAQAEAECRHRCLDDCQCKAYSYSEGGNNQQRGAASSNCFIWTEDLTNLREGILNGGRNLSVRIADSDIESTSRSCEPCGTSIVPYPLSTGSNCGDPMYSNFSCDNSVGKLSFRASSGTHDVISVNPDNRTFIVLERLKGSCDATYREEALDLYMDPSLPFNVRNVKYVCDSSNSSANTAEIEIEWEPPPQPACNSSADCEDWPHSTCNVASDGTRRCLCNTNFKWDSFRLNCTLEKSVVNITPPEISSRSKTALPLIVGVSAACVILFCFIIVSVYVWRKRMGKNQESREDADRNATLLYGTEKRVKELIEREEFNEEDKKGIDVPFFSLESILVATDNFSDANKLGRGGFGPVYKGKFPGGQEIAIKRLSGVSVQGSEEFKNEIVLIARLQHRNLVKLLGYCIKGDEKILLYEYMPNKSLDYFIFDQELGMILNWEARFNIILGIARGLLYLHQDSRLRIIHRDLKTSNILLDEEMNPKISDFGLARIFEGKQTEGETKRVTGTYGYMSPEYALDGLFSVKSDVFSFGVVVLEILSGKKNTGYFWSNQSSRLLGYAWGLWREGKALDLMDETLRESCDANEFLKCVNVALLCVQDDPADRPTMSNLVVMLSSDNATLPTPNQPAFVVKKGHTATASSSSKQETSVDSLDNVGGLSSTSTS